MFSTSGVDLDSSVKNLVLSLSLISASTAFRVA